MVSFFPSAISFSSFSTSLSVFVHAFNGVRLRLHRLDSGSLYCVESTMLISFFCRGDHHQAVEMISTFLLFSVSLELCLFCLRVRFPGLLFPICLKRTVIFGWFHTSHWLWTSVFKVSLWSLFVKPLQFEVLTAVWDFDFRLTATFAGFWML